MRRRYGGDATVNVQSSSVALFSFIRNN